MITYSKNLNRFFFLIQIGEADDVKEFAGVEWKIIVHNPPLKFKRIVRRLIKRRKVQKHEHAEDVQKTVTYWGVEIDSSPRFLLIMLVPLHGSQGAYLNYIGHFLLPLIKM